MAEKKSILLRISPELWDHLNRWARDDLRSFNAQIEFILREALRKRTGRVLADADSTVSARSPAPDGAARGSGSGSRDGTNQDLNDGG